MKIGNEDEYVNENELTRFRLEGLNKTKQLYERMIREKNRE